jgi:hypothetical protein
VARDDDDLRINTLHALSKRSPRVVLEEHSHCEVPAGCGGVVLRWRDPAEGAPMVLSVACAGSVDARLDDRLIPTGFLTVPPGRHVLILEIRGAPAPSPLCVALAPQNDRDRPLYRSAVGPAWEAQPLDGDGPFTALRDGTDLPRPANAWPFDRLARVGASALRLEWPDARVRFTFDAPEAP